MKHYLKIIFAIVMLCISTALIINKKSINNKLAVVTKDKEELRIASGSEILEITNNDGEDLYSKSSIKTQNDSIFNISEKAKLEIIDKAIPNCVETINTKVQEDNLIIDLTKPLDNGTTYEYIVKNNSNEKKLIFYSKSEIKGYSYKVNNLKEDQAPIEINKTDESPIVVQKLDWSKDYYLHIRSFDENENYSENKTFKLDLPSNGVTVKYVDINSNTEISKPEEINGFVKQEYNASDLLKQIEDYQLINNQGELQGILKKEKINVILEYVKNSTIIVNYINKDTGELINNKTIIEGFEGKEIEIKAPKIEGYSCEKDLYLKKMKAGQDILNIYYEEIPKGTIIAKYIDKENNMEISNNIDTTDYINTEYITEPKEIEGYELIETPVNSNGIIKEGTENVEYFYQKIKNQDHNEVNSNLDKNSFETENKNIKTTKVKYIDYETNKTLHTDIITSSDEKTNYKIKKIKGYKIMGKDDFEDKNPIDELIDTLSNDEEFIHSISDKEKAIIPKKGDDTVSEYEIVLNYDESDYIIYYKK